jgi:hypothetical protein
MYGTVAHFKMKPGVRDQIDAFMHRYFSHGSTAAPGYIGLYMFWLDSDPNAAIMSVVFDSRASYLANAASPEQDARYLELRELLEEDPVWYDGEATPYMRF